MSRRRNRRGSDTLVTTVRGSTPQRNTLVASATILSNENPLSQIITTQPSDWQRECWNFYHALGELQFGVGVWLANMVSRVRLVAAELVPGGDEPTPLKEGPYADLVQSLAGGIGGQAAMLKKMTVHLSIPGDSYVIGEDEAGTGDPALFTWRVCSGTEVRIVQRKPVRYQVQEYQGHWRNLADESLVVRVWYPDDELSWLPSSPAQAALGIMREVDFYNRYITAILLSRLALNGLLLIPNEATLPVKPQFADAADPLVAELIDIASKSIKNPGAASSAVPIPLRMPADAIDKVKHLTFATPIEEKIQEHRKEALGRLATALNMPSEVLTGMRGMNHWGQWQMEESGIKTYISPLVEVICYGLLVGYLKPMAQAAGLDLVGPNQGQVVLWYDTSELQKQPDRIKETEELYDRGEANGEALRREAGIEESDKPTDEELKRIVLQKIALGGGTDALKALGLLTGDEKIMELTNPPAPGDGQPGTSEPPSDTQNPGSGTEPTAPGAPAGGRGDKGAPNTRPTAQLASRSCPTCHSIGPRQTLGDTRLLCSDLWHIEVREPATVS